MTPAAAPPAVRKYQLVRVEAGDYLLPDNDGRRLWRLHAYHEDGSGYWVDTDGSEHVIRGRRWNVLLYGGSVQSAALDDDLLDWDHWTYWATTIASRREALDIVMQATTKGITP